MRLEIGGAVVQLVEYFFRGEAVVSEKGWRIFQCHSVCVIGRVAEAEDGVLI